VGQPANLDFRGFAGTIASGIVHVDDEIVVLPSGQVSRVKSIFEPAGELTEAEAGDADGTLANEIDVARSDMLVPVRARPQVADQFPAHLVWMSAEPLLHGRSFLMKINHVTLAATVIEFKHRIDADSVAKLAAETLALNEVGVCNLSVARPVPFDAYGDSRTTGAFILFDRATDETVAAGMIDFPLRRATNIDHHDIAVSKAERSRLMHHKPAVFWLTGLSGAGKSTIANLVEAGLHARGVHTLLLDGGNVRHGLNKDVGFTNADLVQNIPNRRSS
jgi:bifunctional enzyme CysN/CysC